MINLKKRRVITLTNSKIKKTVCILLAGILSCILINAAFEGLFTLNKSVKPPIENAAFTPTLTENFELRQPFSPSSNGLKQIALSYHNDQPLARSTNLHISILDENDEVIYEISRPISQNSGNYKLTIPLRKTALFKNETYTLVVTHSITFEENTVMFCTTTSNIGDVGIATLDGIILENNKSLQMNFVYKYFDIFTYILCWILAIMACLILGVYFRFSEKSTIIFNAIMLVFVPFVTFFLVEKLNFGNVFDMWVVHGILNMVWYYIIYLVLFAALNSLRASLVVGSILLFSCGLINHFTIMFRGTTVLPSDLLAASTAMKVFEKYNFTISRELLLSFLILLCMVQIAAKSNFRIPKMKLRVAVSGFVAAFIIVFVPIYMNTAFLEAVGLTPYQWKQTKACQMRGLVANFTSNIPSLIVGKPPAYNKQAMLDIATTDYGKNPNFDILSDVLPPADGKKPNVIAIMNESFSDLSYFGNLKTDYDPLEYYHSLNENIIKGWLSVPVFGAGTSNSEFEFLTGNSVSFLPFGCVPYQQFVKPDAASIVSTMNSHGYTSLAIHPYDPKGWARTKVYKDFGFERFYSEGDFVGAQKERWYISDQSNYEKLIELYNQNKSTGNPLFLFNVTMQNHGGYDYYLFTPTIRLKDYNGQYPMAEQYLSMMKKSDDAFKMLINYFKTVDEPTIICMFGDHLPKVENEFYAEMLGSAFNLGEESLGDVYSAHQTPFIIWANYDLGVSEPDFGTISSNYLSSVMLSTTGLDMPQYNQYLLNLMQQLPVISATGNYDKNNNPVDQTTTENNTDKLFADYRKLQYNNLIDYKNRDDSVFFVDRD